MNGPPFPRLFIGKCPAKNFILSPLTSPYDGSLLYRQSARPMRLFSFTARRLMPLETHLPLKAFWAEFIADHEQSWQGALARLLRFRTVSGASDPAGQDSFRQATAEGFTYLDRLARSLGFVTRHFDNRVLVAELQGPEGAPILGFPIHLDVVPAGEGWSRDPFGGVIEDDAIWGRGAQDDKGPIVQTLYALAGAVKWAGLRGLTFDRTVRIIILSQEETGVWEDVPYYLRRESPPDFAIVPDSIFPMTVGEKGFLDLVLRFEWERPLPGDFTLRAGERANVVPALARLQAAPEVVGELEDAANLTAPLIAAPHAPTLTRSPVGGLRGEFFGIGAHGSLPFKGYNAAADALAVAAQLPGLADHAATDIFSWLSRVASNTSGEVLGVAADHDRLGPATVNLGVLRADRDGVEAVVNIRPTLGQSTHRIEDRVRSAVHELRTHVGGIAEARVEAAPARHEPFYLDIERFSDWLDPLKRAYKDVTGRPAPYHTMAGTTFAKAFPNAVCFGPVDEMDEEGKAHQADENVTFAAMRRNIEIYGRAIIYLALHGGEREGRPE